MLDGGEVALLGGAVHDVDDAGGQRTADHGQEQASHGQGHCQGDGRVDGVGRVGGAAVKRQDHDDGGGDGGKGGIGSDGRADVGPAEGDHLEGAAQNDALLQVTGDQADERAGHQRLVELELIEDALHAGQQGDDNDEQNRDWVHDPSS